MNTTLGLASLRILLVTSFAAIGCGSNSICSRLAESLVNEKADYPCGCFQAERIVSPAWEIDRAPNDDDGIDEVIVIRSDRTVTFYRGDSVYSKSTFTGSESTQEGGRYYCVLKLRRRSDDRYDHLIEFQDRDHFAYAADPAIVSDGGATLYSRKD